MVTKKIAFLLAKLYMFVRSLIKQVQKKLWNKKMC